MRVLTSAKVIDAEFRRLIRSCRSCKIAVAWASKRNFITCKQLEKYRAKIERMVVGTHFYQTDPEFIEEFYKLKSVRFVMPGKGGGVFHPKIYLFEMKDGTSACITGSANFTKGGFFRNDEAAVLFDSDDDGAEESFGEIRDLIDAYWEDATPIKKRDLVKYLAIWKRKQRHLDRLQEKPASPSVATGGGSVLAMSWKEYFAVVAAEHTHHNLERRLIVLDTANMLFANSAHFADISPDDRFGIAGLKESDPNIPWRWFGAMRGKLWKAVKQSELLKRLSAALDLIPSDGEIGRETYLAYTRQYERAFPDVGAGIGGATRLLSMKRPDTFVCLCNGNRPQLCKNFGIKEYRLDQSPRRLTAYWDEVIEPIMESPWWQKTSPKDALERRVWNGRVALIDAHFYEPQT